MNSAKRGKICLVANTDWYLYNFRLALANELRNIGWEVVLVSPIGSYVPRFAEEGFQWVEWQVDRRGLNIYHEVKSTLRLVTVYKEERPLLVHHYTIKPVIYGSLAARMAKIPAVVNSITGLGYIYLRSGWQGKVLRACVMPLYRLALKQKNVRVIFENKVDQNIFLHNRLIRELQSTIIEGVGVDVNRYQPQQEVEGKTLVVMPARLLWDKGVGVLVDAARQLRENSEHSSIRIALVGMPDPGNPTNIDETQLQKWIGEGLVEYWGFRQDMNEVYHQAHIVCLPSVREGLPTVLIEAAAAGRPIVASDVPGCREVVDHGENGLLVPPGDPIALAEALALLAGDPILRRKMGAAGRLKAVNQFANETIIAATLMVYSDLLKAI
jgi:glycosyltransferase involved in cell wall biosynthesis